MQYSIIMIAVVSMLIFVLSLGTMKVSNSIVEGAVFFTFLLIFEFILVLVDPYIDRYTGGAPGWKLLINALVAAVIFPLHAYLERLIKRKVLR